MPQPSQFVDTLLEKLANFGEPSARFMFGGWGLYLDGVIIAIVADEALYLKVDETTRETFESAGRAPFKPYPDKDSTMSYYDAPPDMLDDEDQFEGWIRLAIEAGLRGARKKRPKSKKP